MIINGLGFSNKPLSLTPLFFKNCPLSLLFREGVEADDFNRFKLGSVLDRCHCYGTELLFAEISLDVCHQEKVNTRFNSLDSTSFTLSGDYLAKTDDDTVKITLGYSKDHRPDLKQVMLEMIVSHEGGTPLIGKVLGGNASDNIVFKERCEKLVEDFKEAEALRYVVADCKMYTEDNSENLKSLLFVTRIPNNIKAVGETIDQALEAPENWETLGDNRKMQTFNVEHYGIKQRWHVLSSETSRQRAIKNVDKHVIKEGKTFVKTPQRIMALLMVILLSLLVYGIAARRLRACLASQKETLPNQIQQATEAPTLRWVFQLLLGVHCLKISTEKQSHQMIEGLTPLREKIL